MQQRIQTMAIQPSAQRTALQQIVVKLTYYVLSTYLILQPVADAYRMFTFPVVRKLYRYTIGPDGPVRSVAVRKICRAVYLSICTHCGITTTCSWTQMVLLREQRHCCTRSTIVTVFCDHNNNTNWSITEELQRHIYVIIMI